jgi:hypothetical protein
VGPSSTIIRARIWPEENEEPEIWQINCYDRSTDRLTMGTVGVWAHGPGPKAWDDLEVIGEGVVADGGQQPAPDPEPTPDPDPEPDPDPTPDPDPPAPGSMPWWYIGADHDWPTTGVQQFTGTMGSKGFDIWNDQKKSWWFHDVTMNGNGADSTLYAVGTDCRVERAYIYGGKHGIRMASATRLRLADSTIKSSSSNLGKSLKICGSYDRGPASSFITVENCDISGIVAIQPLNRTPEASNENVQYVVLRNCVIKPWGNTAIEIAAKHIWIENCTFDFRNTNTSFGRGVLVRTLNTQVPEDVTIRNCKLLLRSDQSGEMFSSTIPIKQ